MPKGEDVRLKVDHVKSKKVEGTLYMMSERMGWMPKHKDVFTLSFDYCDIKCKCCCFFVRRYLILFTHRSTYIL